MFGARSSWLVLALALACAGRNAESSVAPAVAASGPAPEHAAPVEPELAAQVEQARLERDIQAFARLRPPNSAAVREIRETLGQRLQALGLVVEHHAYGSGVNVIGSRRGESTEQVIVSAHYDHIPGCRGADDNASGMAAALEIARVLGEGPFQRTLVVAFWDEEEVGLIGSRAFANRARDRGDRIRLAISLDAIGFANRAPGSQELPEGLAQALPEQAKRLAERGNAGDFIALIANTSAADAAALFERKAARGGLPVISLALPPLAGLVFPDVFRSDHASFWQNGYPSFVLTDTVEFRNPNYHCLNGRDDPETLDLDFTRRVTHATARTVAALLETAHKNRRTPRSPGP